MTIEEQNAAAILANQPKVHIVAILDMSGSMSSIRQEGVELEKKIENLCAFTETKAFRKLKKRQRTSLQNQAYHMHNYNEILKERFIYEFKRFNKGK